MKFKKRTIFSIILLWIASFVFVFPQQFDNVQIKTIPVAEGIYMLVGVGGNIGAAAGEDGVLLIDCQFPEMFEKIKSAVKNIHDGRIRFLLNTNWHYDHTKGNALMAKEGAVIIAHENSRRHMLVEWTAPELSPVLKIPPSPPEALPIITVEDSFNLYFNGQEIRAMHVPHAHSDGDLLFHFKKANVIHTGDLYFSSGFPFINVTSGGTIDGMITAADKILELCDENTKIIPGHGPLADRKMLEAYRNMIATARDRIETLIEAGKSLLEINAEKPLEGLYKGQKTGMPDEIFIKVVYMDLTQKND